MKDIGAGLWAAAKDWEDRISVLNVAGQPVAQIVMHDGDWRSITFGTIGLRSDELAAIAAYMKELK